MQGAVFARRRRRAGQPASSAPVRTRCSAATITGRRHLDARDQLTLEFAGAYRHYHAALMRTFAVGAPRSAAVGDAQGQRSTRCRPAGGAAAGPRRSARSSTPMRACRPAGYARAPQRLRLQSGHDLRAELDGLADVLCAAVLRRRAGNVFFIHIRFRLRCRGRARHDPAGQRPGEVAAAGAQPRSQGEPRVRVERRRARERLLQEAGDLADDAAAEQQHADDEDRRPGSPSPIRRAAAR